MTARLNTAAGSRRLRKNPLSLDLGIMTDIQMFALALAAVPTMMITVRWTSELHRVEEVLDARLKRLQQRA